MTRVIRFLKNQNVGGYSQYSVGEIAGFPDSFSDQMIKAGVAELYGDGIPKNADGSRVVPKGGLARARELLGETIEKIKG